MQGNTGHWQVNFTLYFMNLVYKLISFLKKICICPCAWCHWQRYFKFCGLKFTILKLENLLNLERDILFGEEKENNPFKLGRKEYLKR